MYFDAYGLSSQVPQDFFREVPLQTSIYIHNPLPNRHHWHLTVDKSYHPFPVFVWKRQYAWHILCMLICLKSYFCWDCFDILLSLYGTKIRRHSVEHIVHHSELLGQFVPRTLISLVGNPWLIQFWMYPSAWYASSTNILCSILSVVDIYRLGKTDKLNSSKHNRFKTNCHCHIKFNSFVSREKNLE